ncbi:MAG: DUF2516 family protein [Actinomycetes bacterium]|jgi:hypothetical protein
MFGAVQNFVILIIWVVTVALKGFAFIDCLRRPAAAFPAVSRQSKVLWLIITGLALLLGLLPSFVLNIFGLAGIVAALVYVFDVRQRIINITRR